MTPVAAKFAKILHHAPNVMMDIIFLAARYARYVAITVKFAKILQHVPYAMKDFIFKATKNALHVFLDANHATIHNALCAMKTILLLTKAAFYVRAAVKAAQIISVNAP